MGVISNNPPSGQLGNMKRQGLVQRLKSERGASFSIALLLLLVCIAISSIVIAAATASAGHVAEQAKADQRYYAVTSAVKLFEASLGDDQLTVTFTQTATSKYNNSTGRPVGGTSYDKPSVTADPDPKAIGAKGYGFFLPDITCKVYLGTTYDQASAYSPGSGWMQPFSSNEFLGLTNYKEYKYTVTPNSSVVDANIANKYEVTVTTRLWKDAGSASNPGIQYLELDFASNNTTGEKYHYYLMYGVSVTESDSYWDSGPNTETVGGVDQQVVTRTQTKTTKVTWQLQQAVPGRGLTTDASS